MAASVVAGLVLTLIAGCVATPPATVPQAPGNVAVAGVSGGVHITWNDASSDETGFIVYREVAAEASRLTAEPAAFLSGQEFAQLVALPANTEEYIDYSVFQGGAYRYRVAAVNGAGSSEAVGHTVPDSVSPLPGFEVEVTIEGVGTVTIEGKGQVWSCPASCTLVLPAGAELSLQATGNEGNSFASWSGVCQGANPNCSVAALGGPLSVGARFGAIVLRFELFGDSPADITISPGEGGIGSAICEVSPGGSCGYVYPSQLAVSLAVQPTEAGGAFSSFGGDCSSPTGNFCLVNLSGLTSVTATVVRPPTSVTDGYSTSEDVEVAIPAQLGVLANDSDSAGDTLTAIVESDPTNGQLQFAADGSFAYLPDPDFTGLDGFSYLARDHYGNLSAPASVTITVLPVNDPPVFQVAADPPAIQDGQGPVNIPGFATGIGPGGGSDEAGQVVAFDLQQVAAVGTLLFTQEPNLAVGGTLSFEHQIGTFGSASYDIVLVDDGPTDNGGNNTSASVPMTITVLPLDLTVSWSGDGAVSPGSGSYPYGAVINLEATPAAGWGLREWGGACAGTVGLICNLVVTADAQATATFAQIRTLTVTLSGTALVANGSVVSTPSGIACSINNGTPGPCAAAQFLDGESVTLTATTGLLTVFSTWSGDCVGAVATCEVTMNDDLEVGAEFVFSL